MAIPSEGLKVCKVCLVPKPGNCFYVVKIKPGGRQTPGEWLVGRCKACTLTHQLHYYHNEGGKTNRISKEAVIKDAAFRAYGGYQCACCGEERADVPSA